MKRFITLLLLAGLSPLLAAQDASQPLPSAPSATRYPPKPVAPPPAAQPPATDPETPASTTAGGTGTSTTPADSGSASTTSAALPGGAAAPAPPATDDVPLTTITKRVDEVNVVF